MASIDVRSQDIEIDTIIFAGEDPAWTTATHLAFESENVVGIVADGGRQISYKIFGKESAKNLIKALEKAIELGWFKF